jgi:hypothetical protein
MRRDALINYGLLGVSLGLPSLLEFLFGRKWGIFVALILVVGGVAFLVVGHRTSEGNSHASRYKETYFVLGAALSLIVILFFPLSKMQKQRILEVPKSEETGSVEITLTKWGTDPPATAYGIIDGAKLFAYKYRYRLMLVIRASDHTIEPLDDVAVMKSSIFEVKDTPVRIDILMSQGFLRHMMALNPNIATIDFWPCVVPRDFTPDERKSTLREFMKLGASCVLGGESTVSRPFAIIPQPQLKLHSEF